MYNEQYYKDKKQKIAEKFEKKKNDFLASLFNATAGIQQELNDLKVEHEEIVKLEEENKKEETKNA